MSVQSPAAAAAAAAVSTAAAVAAMAAAAGGGGGGNLGGVPSVANIKKEGGGGGVLSNLNSSPMGGLVNAGHHLHGLAALGLPDDGEYLFNYYYFYFSKYPNQP